MAEKKALSEQEKRMKAALRDNLKRRKVASRKSVKPPSSDKTIPNDSE